MVSPVNTNWLYEYGLEDIPVPDVNFSALGSGFSWNIQPFTGSTNARCNCWCYKGRWINDRFGRKISWMLLLTMDDHPRQNCFGIGSRNGIHNRSSVYFGSFASQNQRCTCQHQWPSYHRRAVSFLPNQSIFHSCTVMSHAPMPDLTKASTIDAAPDNCLVMVVNCRLIIL